MIENEKVIERVMRMGIEHRAGVPRESLWDLAMKQLTQEAKRAKSVSSKYATIAEWFDEMSKTFTLAFAFVQKDNKLEVMRFSEPPSPEKFQFIGWSSPTMPRFALKN